MKTKSTSYVGVPEDMKKWYKVKMNNVWLPSFITLPVGMVFPLSDENKDGESPSPKKKKAGPKLLINIFNT